MKFILLLIIIITFSCCDKEEEKKFNQIEIAKHAIDSFTIKQLVADGSELYNICLYNDSTLLSTDGFDKILLYAKNINKQFIFKKALSIENNPKEIHFIHINRESDRIYIFEKDKTILEFDFNFKKLNKYITNFKFPFLKQEYFLSFSQNIPLIKYGNEFYSNYTHLDVIDFNKTYLEKWFVKFELTNDTIVKHEQFISKPFNFGKWDYFNYSHCLAKNTIYKLVGSFDTLYYYNIEQKREGKHYIGNKDYSLPKPDYLLDDSRGDMSAATKKEMISFNYTSIYYNESTNHLILFYRMPLLEKELNGKKFTDKEIRAIVLNDKLEVVKYLTFKEKYLDPICYMYIKGKGIAIPKFTEDYESEIKFYIYNF